VSLLEGLISSWKQSFVEKERLETRHQTFDDTQKDEKLIQYYLAKQKEWERSLQLNQEKIKELEIENKELRLLLDHTKMGKQHSR
jgi:hypothetical protein